MSGTFFRKIIMLKEYDSKFSADGRNCSGSVLLETRGMQLRIELGLKYIAQMPGKYILLLIGDGSSLHDCGRVNLSQRPFGLNCRVDILSMKLPAERYYGAVLIYVEGNDPQIALAGTQKGFSLDMQTLLAETKKRYGKDDGYIIENRMPPSAQNDVLQTQYSPFDIYEKVKRRMGETSKEKSFASPLWGDLESDEFERLPDGNIDELDQNNMNIEDMLKSPWDEAPQFYDLSSNKPGSSPAEPQEERAEFEDKAAGYTAEIIQNIGNSNCPIGGEVERCNPFYGMWPEAIWHCVEYSTGEGWHYIKGDIYENGKLLARAIGVPGNPAPRPPSWLEGFSSYYRSSDGKAKGYWMMFQDTEGNLIKL